MTSPIQYTFQAYFDDQITIFGTNEQNDAETLSISLTSGIQAGQYDPVTLDGKINFYENNLKNHIQQIPVTQLHTLVTADKIEQKLTIFTFNYTGQGNIQQVCKDDINYFSYISPSSTKRNLFYNMQFGILNEEYMWIKGNEPSENKTFILLSNPMTCKIINKDSSRFGILKLN
ncbi:hypothetical protein PPERSA_10413 [Pseudocohnilembus persalinus]|uniref:Uncharacterized protein n=1 Tax=Pseudocohnilembus persalinus TaxID=266149 RepID=A0A0V0QWE8_PSEPJ|nr:hypothetical protein PPERSA_10413 [Pseudocohnilembus persalinus]|eukprot:KRX06555.1 hypothetical protein PPERSA_10413 [Pseudocohnilembus persalinus]